MTIVQFYSYVLLFIRRPRIFPTNYQFFPTSFVFAEKILWRFESRDRPEARTNY